MLQRLKACRVIELSYCGVIPEALRAFVDQG
jgi:hypothetical protein